MAERKKTKKVNSIIAPAYHLEAVYIKCKWCKYQLKVKDGQNGFKKQDNYVLSICNSRYK